jgi:hypothetical protein
LPAEIPASAKVLFHGKRSPNLLLWSGRGGRAALSLEPAQLSRYCGVIVDESAWCMIFSSICPFSRAEGPATAVCSAARRIDGGEHVDKTQSDRKHFGPAAAAGPSHPVCG